MAQNPRFSDDSKILAFIQSGAEGTSLVALDADSGARATLVSASTARAQGRPKTAAAALLRERRRAPSEGLTDFSWIPGSSSVVVPLGQSIMSVDAGRSVAAGEAGARDGAPGGAPLSHPILEVRSLAAPVVLAGEDPVAIGQLRPVSSDAEPVDVKPSDCGRYVGFLLDDEVCVARADGVGPVLQVTFGARGTGGVHSNGSADFLSAEEFDRYSGWWWSPDSSCLLVQTTDNSPVAEIVLPRLTTDSPCAPDAVERHRYAFAGTANPCISFRVVAVGDVLAALDAAGTPRSGLPTWPGKRVAPAGFSPPSARAASASSSPSSRGPVPLRPVLALTSAARSRHLCLGPSRPDGSPPDVYVCDAGFCPDSSAYLQVVSRDHTRLDLVRFCPDSGRAELLVREAAPTSWVNSDKLLTWIADPTGGAPSPAPSPRRSFAPLSPAPPSPRSRERLFFVWASERSGFRHLYLYAVRRSFSFEADLTIARARAAAMGDDPSAVGAEDARGVPSGPGDPRSVVLHDDADSEATLRRPITGGDWVVSDAAPRCGNGSGVAVSADTHSVFFAANAASPLERHVYRAPILVHRGAGSPGGHATPSSPSSANAWVGGDAAAASSLRRSLRPRVASLVTVGDTLDDMHSWGLTVGTYSVTQVTPGTRGCSGMVFSPDCTRAVLTRASLDVERGAVTTDLVAVTFPGQHASPGLPAPQLSMPQPLRPPRRGAAPDITAPSTPSHPGGVEGGTTTSPSSPATPAPAVAPRPTFPFPDPAVASSLGFPLGIEVVSPSGYASTLLTRIAGPAVALTEPDAAADPSSAASAAPATLTAGKGPAKGILFFTCPAADGTTTLFGTLRLPDGQDQPAPGPPPAAVLFVYGGPHAQLVRDDARALGASAVAPLRAAGAAVFTVDGRGSFERGRRFETAVSRRFGLTDVADQLVATRFLAGEGLIDPQRLGVFGWSYGGFMTLMLLAKSAAVGSEESFGAGILGAPHHAPGPVIPAAPRSPASPTATPGVASPPSPATPPPAPVRSLSGSGVVEAPPVCFRAGVAGGSVTEWENYDSAYTERYMGTPADEPEAYRRASALAAVPGLRHKHVLLVHGAMDENVLLRNTQRVVAAAIKHDIPLETFILPDSRHGPGVAAKAVAAKTVAHLVRHLGL